MKKTITPSLAIAVILGSLLLFQTGCGKKTVIPPDSDPNATAVGSDMSGGNNINYPIAEGGYTVESLPSEGTLDDSTTAGLANSAAAMAAIDQQSEEYKRLHGRSSANLFPIYFDFDQAGVRPDMTETLFRNAEYINSVPGRMVVLEGNSDERGTNEYNLALGERRAINAQLYLINLGVDPRRVRTLSYGEEKPLFLGQDEESYGMNRRVDFVLQ